jgi:uncharacterized lipoprotein
VGTAAGIGGYKYYHGTLAVIYQAPYRKTWDATLRALESMDLAVMSKKHDLIAGKIIARRADKKDIYIDVKYKSSNETEAKIRIGAFGDQAASMAIRDEIRKELFKE